MNCLKCNAPADYRFPTTCQHCQAELPSATPCVETIESPSPVQSPKSKLTIVACIGKAILMLVTSGLSTIGGAVVTFFLAGAFYRMFLYDPAGPHNCSSGIELFFLSILTGGFLGFTASTWLQVSHLVTRRVTEK